MGASRICPTPSSDWLALDSTEDLVTFDNTAVPIALEINIKDSFIPPLPSDVPALKFASSPTFVLPGFNSVIFSAGATRKISCKNLGNRFRLLSDNELCCDVKKSPIFGIIT